MLREPALLSSSDKEALKLLDPLDWAIHSHWHSDWE